MPENTRCLRERVHRFHSTVRLVFKYNFPPRQKLGSIHSSRIVLCRGTEHRSATISGSTISKNAQCLNPVFDERLKRLDAVRYTSTLNSHSGYRAECRLHNVLQNLSGMPSGERANDQPRSSLSYPFLGPTF